MNQGCSLFLRLTGNGLLTGRINWIKTQGWQDGLISMLYNINCKIMAGKFKFTFGPWNIHEGADPFGPVVRKTVDFDRKLEYYKELGYDAIQFHDDDAVPELNKLTTLQIVETARNLKNRITDKGLAAEFVAPRLW